MTCTFTQVIVTKVTQTKVVLRKFLPKLIIKVKYILVVIIKKCEFRTCFLYFNQKTRENEILNKNKSAFVI